MLLGHVDANMSRVTLGTLKKCYHIFSFVNLNGCDLIMRLIPPMK